MFCPKLLITGIDYYSQYLFFLFINQFFPIIMRYPPYLCSIQTTETYDKLYRTLRHDH